MTMTPRPRENADTFARAAVSVADQILRKAPGAIAIGEEVHEARDRLVSVIVGLRGEVRHGGVHMAERVSALAGFRTNDLVTELFEDFPSEMSRVVAEDIRAWVARDRPKPPFETAAAVTILAERSTNGAGRTGVVQGVGIRVARLDESAYALFVPLVDRATFVSSKGARGARLITWEQTTSVSPLAEGDMELVAVARAREARIAAPPRGAPDAGRSRATGVYAEVARLASEERAAALVGFLDAASEALRGTDEEAARSSIAALEASLAALRMLESGGGRMPLVGSDGTAPSP